MTPEATVLTVRGVSPATLDVLRREATAHRRSLSRHVAALLDEAAEHARRREALAGAAAEIATLRQALPEQSTDSAALLWAERGGR